MKYQNKEEKKLRNACEKEEIVVDLQQEHQNEINAFINKYRHIEYDHDIFINEKLPNKSQELWIKKNK